MGNYVLFPCYHQKWAAYKFGSSLALLDELLDNLLDELLKTNSPSQKPNITNFILLKLYQQQTEELADLKPKSTIIMAEYNGAIVAIMAILL